jgi:hypothetical protein
VDSTPVDSSDRPLVLANLCGALLTRYRQTGQPADLEGAIATAQEAMDGACQRR